MAGNHTFPLKIITPYGLFFDGPVLSVTARTANGYLGILKNHIQVIANIEISILYLRETAAERPEFAIGGGLLFVEKDQTTIITDYIIAAEKINAARAKEDKEAAEALLKTKLNDQEVSKTKIRLQRAINALNVASHLPHK